MNPNKYFEFEYNGESYVVPREWLDEHDKQIRAEAIENKQDKIKQLKDNINEVYKCQLFCMEDMCAKDNPSAHDCVSCFYDAVMKEIDR